MRILHVDDDQGLLEVSKQILTIENNFDPESIPRKGEGIGLKNIRNRLKLIYNQENLLTVQKDTNRFSVNIFIPVG